MKNPTAEQINQLIEKLKSVQARNEIRCQEELAQTGEMLGLSITGLALELGCADLMSFSNWLVFGTGYPPPNLQDMVSRALALLRHKLAKVAAEEVADPPKIQDLQQRLDQAEAELANTKTDLQRMTDLYELAADLREEEAADSKLRLDQAEAELAKTKACLEQVEAEAIASEEEVEELELRIEGLKAQLENNQRYHERELKETQEKAKYLKSQIDQPRFELQKMKIELEDALKEKTALQNDVARLEYDVVQLRRDSDEENLTDEQEEEYIALYEQSSVGASLGYAKGKWRFNDRVHALQLLKQRLFACQDANNAAQEVRQQIAQLTKQNKSLRALLAERIVNDLLAEEASDVSDPE